MDICDIRKEGVTNGYEYYTAMQKITAPTKCFMFPRIKPNMLYIYQKKARFLNITFNY